MLRIMGSLRFIYFIWLNSIIINRCLVFAPLCRGHLISLILIIGTIDIPPPLEHTTRTDLRPGIGERLRETDRPKEANGTRFGDRDMDTIIGKGGKGVILTLIERSTNLIFMEKLKNGKDPKALAKVVVRLLYPFKGIGVFTITTDN